MKNKEKTFSLDDGWLLSGDRLSLRELREDDWEAVHQYASLEIVCKYQPWGPNTEEDSKDFVGQVIRDKTKIPRSRYVFSIIYQNKMVGAGEVNIRDFTNRAGEISYIVHPDYWGQGIATEAASLLIEFGFENLKLHRVYATCDPRNIGSSTVLEKVGMSREGRIREHLCMKGFWRDSLLYSILEDEWTRRESMQFEEIDVDMHRDFIVKFRKDSFNVSFGDVSGFGDPEEYIQWLEEKKREFPEGFVLVKEAENYIGQLELSIREYDGKRIGYVHLYYLIPEMRGQGRGGKLHDYATQFFKKYGVDEFHLRVSPTNTGAIKFYWKNGMEEIGTEVEGKVIRMKGYV